MPSKGKDEVRKEVWKAMDREKVSRFPGADGRIPNFAGAKLAAEKLAGHRAWRRARVIKANPDSPQTYARRTALEEGKTVIFLGTPARREALRRRLRSDGVETEAFLRLGRFIELDDAEVLASFMDGDVIDEVRFHKGTTELLAAAMRAATSTPPRVAACGDCAGILWAEGKADAAFQLERLWDEAGSAYGLDILCCYVLPDVLNAQDEEFYERIRLMHAAAH